MLATPNVCPTPVNHNHGSRRNDDLLTPQQLWFPPTAFLPYTSPLPPHTELAMSQPHGRIWATVAFCVGGIAGLATMVDRAKVWTMAHRRCLTLNLGLGLVCLSPPRMIIKAVLDQSSWPILIVVSTDKASLTSHLRVSRARGGPCWLLLCCCYISGNMDKSF